MSDKYLNILFGEFKIGQTRAGKGTVIRNVEITIQPKMDVVSVSRYESNEFLHTLSIAYTS